MIELTDAIGVDEGDDPTFVGLMQNIIESEVNQREPAELFVVRIDNWFDHKWLGFASKRLGAFGVWPQELSVPPFNPGRVRTQTVISRDTGGGWRSARPVELHPAISSESNIGRKVRTISQSAVFVWFSSGSKPNGRASMMLYWTSEASTSGWYAGFKKNQTWQGSVRRGIAPEMLEKMSNP